MPPERFEEPAPAKINLALHVTGRRADGYHTLHSLCVFTALADHLSAVPARRDTLSAGGPFGADLPPGRSNLVIRAVEKFRARFPDHLPQGVAIHLDKHLPVAAGLGGGSADAAAALRLLTRMGQGAIADAALREVALSLGADVPMCLYSRPCEVFGIGERIRPIAPFPGLHLVLVNPLAPVETAQVFGRLARRDNPPMPPLPEALDRLSLLSLWLEDTRNDLQEPAAAILPAIPRIIAEVGRAPGCVLARMSGSGATVFGVFGSAAAAHQAAQDLRARLDGYWVSATPLAEG